MVTKKLQKTKINWSYIVGLLQTDGNFYYLIEADGTFKPKVTLTITGKRPEFIKEIRGFLTREGLSLVETVVAGHGNNLVIDRQQNVFKFLAKLKELSNKSNSVSLVGSKKLDQKMLEKAFDLNTIRKKSTTADEKALACKQLLDLKVKFSNEKTGPDQLSSNKYCERLGLPQNSNWQGTSDVIYNQCFVEAEEATQKMVRLSETFTNVDDIYPEYGYYILGATDGDGSFQVNVKTHGSPSGRQVVNPKTPGKGKWTRRYYEISPAVTLTQRFNPETLASEGKELFTIFKNLFVVGKPRVKLVQKSIKADRLYITAQKDLSNKVVPFFERFPPAFDRSLNRFRVLRLALNNLVKLRNSKYHAKCFVKLLYNHSDYGSQARSKSLEEILILIEKEFTDP